MCVPGLIGGAPKVDTSAQTAELKRQNDQQAALDAQNKAERDAEAAAAQKSAADRAAAAQAYATGRNLRSDQLQGSVNNAFSGFDDNYYNKFTNDYLGYYNPQIDQQYTDAQKSLTYALANSGNLDSSAAADKFGRLEQSRATNQASIAQAANAARDSLKQRVGQTRSDLLNQGLSASVIGPDTAPASIDDVNNELAGADNRIGNFQNLITSQATSAAAPQTFSPLGDLFSNLLDNIGNYAKAQRTNSFISSSPSSYIKPAGSAGSGRTVGG